MLDFEIQRLTLSKQVLYETIYISLLKFVFYYVILGILQPTGLTVRIQSLDTSIFSEFLKNNSFSNMRNCEMKNKIPFVNESLTLRDLYMHLGSSSSVLNIWIGSFCCRSQLS